MYSRRYSYYGNPVYRTRYSAYKGTSGIYRRPTQTSTGLSRRYVYRGLSKRYVQRVIGQMAEQKYWDTTQVNFQVQDYYFGGPLCCTLIPQGTTDSARIGDKVFLNSLQYSFIIAPESTTGPCIKHYAFRLIIFQWYDDTTPQWSNILQSVGLPYENMVQSPFEHDRKVKRKIFVNRTIHAHQSQSNGSTVSASVNFPVMFQGVIDFKNRSKKIREISFEAATTSGIGRLWYGILSCEQDQDALPPYTYGVGLASSYIRVTYTDM